MEIHRQRCQQCNSLDLHNLLVREPGHDQVVYVRCARCEELVARYELSGYYHHGKGFESWLRSRSFPMESGRDVTAAFQEAKAQALAGYEAMLAELSALDKGD